MARRLFTLLSALSLLLCVAVVVLWNAGRNYPQEILSLTLCNRVVQVYSRSGAAHVFCSRGLPQDPALLHAEWEKTASADPQRRFDGVYGFGPSLCLQLPSVTGGGYTYLHLPFWLPAVVLAAPAALWLYRLFRHGRRAAGVCPSCGYDLRATPGRCPECGTGKEA